jgi:O-antigen/teichoic acid export membrane protein
LLNLLQIAVLFVLSPFVLHRIGTDANGIWLTVVAFTGILSLLILGVPMASVRFIGERVAKKDPAGVNTAISTCLTISSCLGVVALMVGVGLWFIFTNGYLNESAVLALGPDLQQDAKIAFGLVVVQVALAFGMRLPYGIFDAHQDFVAKNTIMASELVLRLALTLLLISWHASLISLAWVQLLCMLFEFAVVYWVVKRRHPAVAIGYRSFDKTLVKKILSFSIFVMLLNVGTLIAFRIDALVIGAFMEPKYVTWFDFGNKFFDPMTGLLIAVGAVVMPMAIRLKATGDFNQLREVFLKWSKICFSLVIPIGIYLMVAGPSFLGWWVGPEFIEPSGRVLQVLMLSFVVYLPVRGVALPVLMGLGNPKVPALGLLIMGLANLTISLALVERFGILGVAVGTAVPNVIFAMFILTRACVALDIDLKQYVVYVVGRAATGAVLPLTTILAFQWFVPFAGIAQLIGGGFSMMLVFVLVWVFYVYRNDPYLDLLSLVRKASLHKSGAGT